MARHEKLYCKGEDRDHDWKETTLLDYVQSGRTYECRRCPETTSIYPWRDKGETPPAGVGVTCGVHSPLPWTGVGASRVVPETAPAMNGGGGFGYYPACA